MCKTLDLRGANAMGTVHACKCLHNIPASSWIRSLNNVLLELKSFSNNFSFKFV